MNQNIDMLEKRMTKIEKENQKIQGHLKQLEAEIDLILKERIETSKADSSIDKIKYLQEVNEQMFQQNVRLRALIERCIDEKVVPTQESYYEALKEGDVLEK